MPKFIGIDFSGGARPWRVSVRLPTVWIASVRTGAGKPQLDDLTSVQALPGNGHPFDRLVQLLANADYEVAAIDAPFSLPLIHLPDGGSHAALLQLVRSLPDGIDRPFPNGNSIVALGNAEALNIERKPLRRTEEKWVRKGVNTRSTMWNGPRGGAPFTAACLRLIERSERPCWPWSEFRPGILAEAFPAAQLHQWNLPYKKYSGTEASAVRKTIMVGISQRLQISSYHADIMLKSTDALDAVIATFAGIAIADGKIADFFESHAEGFIAVAS